MNITASNYIHCNMEETVKHIFWGCPLAKAVWRNLSQVLASFVGNQSQWEIALLGDDHHFSPHLVGLWHVVRVSILFSLWKDRCSLVLNGTPISAAETSRKIGRCISEQIRTFRLDFLKDCIWLMNHLS